MTPEHATAQVLQLLRRAAHDDYIGEPVSQLTHMLQGAHFARRAGACDEDVLAALLHDIGHLCAPPDAPQMDGLGVLRHEHIGADFLAERGFSSVVCALVRRHVDAKRFLVSRRTGYRKRLSLASRRTLDHQGGPMGDEEAALFQRHPLFERILRVRAWDEQGKWTDLSVEDLESYRALILRHLQENRS